MLGCGVDFWKRRWRGLGNHHLLLLLLLPRGKSSTPILSPVTASSQIPSHSIPSHPTISHHNHPSTGEEHCTIFWYIPTHCAYTTHSLTGTYFGRWYRQYLLASVARGMTEWIYSCITHSHSHSPDERLTRFACTCLLSSIVGVPYSHSRHQWPIRESLPRMVDDRRGLLGIIGSISIIVHPLASSTTFFPSHFPSKLN